MWHWSASRVPKNNEGFSHHVTLKCSLGSTLASPFLVVLECTCAKEVQYLMFAGGPSDSVCAALLALHHAIYTEDLHAMEGGQMTDRERERERQTDRQTD